MTISGALASVNAAITTLKALRGIEKAYDQAVLRAQIVDLMGNVTDAKVALLEAQDELAARDKEIHRLSEALQARSDLIEGPDGYRWLDTGDGVKRGYPICPACYLEGRHVQMVRKGSHLSAVCPACEKERLPVDCYLEPAADGSQMTVREKRQADEDAQRRRDTDLIHGRKNWMG